MNLTEIKNNRKKQLSGALIFILLFIASAAFVIYRCRFGLGSFDESFYLTVPYRLYQGDSLFGDEWHLSQMASVLIYPFVYIYMTVFKSTDGMLLTFRYIYIAVQALASVIIFNILRKTDIAGAVVSSIAFFLYAPFSINAMSYNSLGITCLALACVIFYSDKGCSVVKRIISGILYAFSVLCCPYLAVLYLIYILGIIFLPKILKKLNITEFDSLINKKGFFCCTAGVAAAAAVFAVIVFSKISLSEFFGSFEGLLSDPDHNNIGIVLKFIHYFSSIIVFKYAATPFLYAAFFVIFAASVFDKKRSEHRKIYIILYAVIAVGLFAIYYFKVPYLNYVCFPLNVFALGYVPLFYDNKRAMRLFVYLWIPGMVYSVCIHFTSNMNFFAISSASSVALIGSIVFIRICISEMIKNESRAVKGAFSALLACLMCVQLFTLASLRYSKVFLEKAEMNELTSVVDEGFFKGVHTTESLKKGIEEDMRSADIIRNKYPDADSILIFSQKTWLYMMCSEYGNSAYSAWLSGVKDSSLERLKMYYSVNPEKLPDLIYIDKENSSFADKLTEEYDCTPETIETGAILLVRNK